MRPAPPKLSLTRQKYLQSLSVKKYRYQERRFLVEGEKMVAELLTQARLRVEGVYGLPEWYDQHRESPGLQNAEFSPVTEAELKKISTQTTPNAVLAVAHMPEEGLDVTLPTRQYCFFLDALQDPGNLGTILRIADWFGWPAVYCGPGCADPFNPKVVQASMGAIFRIKTWEVALPDLLKQQPDLPVLGAVLGGENIFDTPCPDHGLLVMGNESRGISPETEALLTQRITIPRHPAGGAESLNAAVAAGILAAICSGGRLSTAVRR